MTREPWFVPFQRHADEVPPRPAEALQPQHELAFATFMSRFAWRRRSHEDA